MQTTIKKLLSMTAALMLLTGTTLAEEAKAPLSVLDVRPAAFFTERGFRDQHAGGQAFAHEASVMGWLFGEHALPERKNNE